MAEFKKLAKPYSKYEVSETNMVRQVKNSSFVSKDAGGKTIRLTDDDGNRKSIKIENLQSMVEVAKGSKKDKVVKPAKKASAKKETKEPYGKLSMADAGVIRTHLTNKTMKAKDLAKKYNVHVSSIYDVKNFVFKKEEVPTKK